MLNTLQDFYSQFPVAVPQDQTRDIGHFNVFSLENLYDREHGKHIMPYSRRAYYKISLIRGRNRAEYADKVIEIEKNALLFATPRIPYHWLPLDNDQWGNFCIFSQDFMTRSKTGMVIDDLPIFKPGEYPVFQVSDEEMKELEYIFLKMFREITSEYAFKYDLLRNLVSELIHYGQKLQPAASVPNAHNASERIFSLFIELQERQFPVESIQKKISLKAPRDYADRLAVHVNHLNKVLKEKTGKTTTEVIGLRILQEAKILLRQTDWNISEIAFCLGFEEVAHFSNFFRKHTSLTPVTFRSSF
jgi:AraC family transcriptional regulator, transcriptional activator of pobA